MSFEFAGYQQRSDRFQQELEAPMEDVLGATAEQAITESPINSILRFSELANANVSQDRLDAVVARQRLKDAGLEGRLTIPDTGIATPTLDILMDRKKEEIRRQDILSRAPSGFGSKAQQLGMAFAASALDPLNVGLSFVPVVGQARYMRYLAGAKGILGRTAIRAGVGAVEGAAGAAIIEPLIYSAKTQEQADYDMTDSLLNVAFGTVFGGGLHVLGGLAADAGKALSPARVAKPRIEPTIDGMASRVDAMPLPEREIAMRTAVAQAMQGKAVDVEAVIPQRQIDSPEFKQWLGTSRVVDDDGLPMTLYHGTRQQFDAFDTTRGSTPGAWFTASRESAEQFGEAKPVHLSIKNPATLADLAEARRQVSVPMNAKAGDDAQVAGTREFNEAVIANLESKGFDGIHDKNFKGAGGKGGEVWAAFRPEQIKSATSRTTAGVTDARAAAQRQSSPESETAADVPAAQAADRQLAETPLAKDPIAEQEALLANELQQLKEAAKVADIDLGDELAEFDDALKLADEYGKAARAAVLCGMAH
jgi:hypothetical protein